MLDNQGFDLWADGYDRSVGLSEEDGSYPFAGYKAVLGGIYRAALLRGKPDVLDIGFGTATLSSRLYAQGCGIWGVDFSARMLEIAQEKMPGATLVQADFSKGIPPALCRRTYDCIVATYALHHLTDEEKTPFIKALMPLLREGGAIYVGDVAFENRRALEACARASGDEWDTDEFYFVYDELAAQFDKPPRFEKLSHCAGILTWEK